ncbi:MAG: EthD protein [Rhodobacteraceae bacterium HLUCCA12]|nr:MAG: EthD protein [Rhodobacteraceae bacterium HLUCCA12]
MPIWRRYSFLKRNAALSRDAFSTHYEQVHGPLAAGLEGFRKFATAYRQNHVEGDGDHGFDGLTITTQSHREDYSKGFFNHSDYAKVQPDEQYLFDVGKTVSVLGTEEPEIDGPRTRWKVLMLADAVPSGARGLTRLVRNALDLGSASALGFGGASFDHGTLWELWFDSAQSRERFVAQVEGASIAAPVREVHVYGPETA